MTEQAVRRGVGALRFTVKRPPRRLNDLADFFASLSDMYTIATVIAAVEQIGDRYGPLTDQGFDHLYREVPRESAYRVSVENLSMRSPLEFALTAAAQSGTYALGILYLLLKAPEKFSRVPNLHAQWHEGRLRTEFVKAQRHALRMRLEAGDIDVLTEGLDHSAREE